jgi:outer membrane protein TolC
LKKHLSLFSILVFLSIDSFSDDLLSNLKKRDLANQRESAKVNADKLKNDWINSVTISYTKSRSNSTGKYLDSETSQISLSQPIFRSGGIYYAIKYADAVREYSNISIDLQEKELISSVMEVIYNLKKIDLQIKKQKLLLDNSNIEVLKKEELFKEGLLDSSELDSAILNRNSTQTTLYSLMEQKDELIKSFKNLSDMEYTKVSINGLKTPTLNEYMDNLLLMQQKADVEQKEYLKNMQISNQLVTLSLEARYTKNYAKASSPLINDDSKYYGATISMPILDINALKKIELKKLDLIKSKLELAQVKRELKESYEAVMRKLENVNKKIDLSKKDYQLYINLLEDIKDKYSVGLVTKYDVNTLNNSKIVKEIDKNIYYIDKQILLLSLYSNMRNKFE